MAALVKINYLAIFFFIYIYSIVGTNSLNQSQTDEELLQTNQRLRDLVQRLATTLTTILDVDVALRNNLMSLHETLAEVQDELSPSIAKF